MRYTRSNVSISRGFNVPYCSKCGFQFSEEMQFCPNCGTQVKPFLPRRFNTTSQLKGGTQLGNGIAIGLGAACFLIGLFGLLVLNSTFWRLHESFVAEGLQPLTIRFLLRDTARLIGVCGSGIILGTFVLIVGAMNQVSPTARATLNSKSMKASMARGLATAGVIGLTNSMLFLAPDIYFNEPRSLEFSFALALISACVIGIGAVLFNNARILISKEDAAKKV